MADAGDLCVEVVYAASVDTVFRRTLRLPAGSRVSDAVRASGLAAHHPSADWRGAGNLGVFGMPVAPQHLLHEGDRIEVYRALAQHPMQARRARAERGRR